MIIISYGLPKSASTITYTYTEELLLASGIKNGQQKFKAFFKEGFVYKFGITSTLLIILIHAFYGSIVIKTHSAPSFFIRFLLKLYATKATCTIRDPRDIVLSAIDHGKRKEPNNPFKKFTSINNALPAIIEEFKKCEKWLHYKNILVIRYENITQSPATELHNISNYLSFTLDIKTISIIINKYEKTKNLNKNFNKGTTNRYRSEMSEEEISLCNSSANKYIHLLGYQL